MTNWIEHVYDLLKETPLNRDYATLKIIDLYYKSNPNKDAKQHIDKALNDWERILKWDVKNLKKHINESNTFFQTANIIIKTKLGFFSMNFPDILILEDLAHSLDLYSKYKYNAKKRKIALDAIEKAWKEHGKHNSRNQKKPIPQKKTFLWVSNICFQTIESQEFGKTQPASIKHVVERFNASKPTRSKTKSPPIRFPLDKTKVKQLGVVLDSGTKKIIAALAKKLSMYNYQILETAVEYCVAQRDSNSTQRQTENSEHPFTELDKRRAHPKNTNNALESSENAPTEDKKQQLARDEQVFETNKAQDLLITHPSTESTQKPTVQPTVELQKSIEPMQLLEAEQQTAHLQHQTSTSEKKKAALEALEARKIVPDTTPSSVNNNEIADSDQQEKQHSATDNVHFSETSQRIESKQSISNDGLPTTPEQSQQAEPEQNHQLKPTVLSSTTTRKPEEPKHSETALDRSVRIMQGMNSFENLAKRSLLLRDIES